MSDGLSPLSLTRPRAISLGLAAVAGAVGVARPRDLAPGVVLAALGILGSVPVSGRAPSDRLARLAGFLARSRWTRIAWRREGDALEVAGRGRALVALEVIEPRGRLDLAGADVELAGALGAMVERASRCGADRTITWHVTREGDAPRLVVARPTDVAAVAGASSAPGEIRALVPAPWALERWRHVRSAEGYHCSWRASGEDPLVGRSAALAEPGVVVTTSLRVVARERADRLAGRLAHRWRVDAAITQRLGFRARARELSLGAGLERSEGHVASGRALCEVVVLVRATARSRRELAALTARVSSSARRLGVHLARQDGAHVVALCAQLPGAPTRLR
jgi:hypothetical protein